jgi:hypothetical protein
VQALRAVGLGLAALPSLWALAGAPAQAYEIASFDGAVYRAGVQDQTNYADDAGEHPHTGVVEFAFTTDAQGEPTGVTKDLRVDIPPGLVPNPEAFPRCTDAQLEAAACPPASQVGTQELKVRGHVLGLLRQTAHINVPIYNMTVAPDQVARFSFNAGRAPLSETLSGDKSPIHIIGGVRDTTDFGLFFTIRTPQDPALVYAKQTFWGTPGAADHDAERGKYCTLAPVPACTGGGQTVENKTMPFLTNPTACLGILRTNFRATSYEGETRTSFKDTPRGSQRCERVPFAPTATFGSSPLQRDAPSALTVGLRVPQSTSEAVPGTAHVKRVAVTLPPGATISPSAGNGLQACSDAQLAAGTHDPVGCPAGSRVGSVSITSPLVPEPLTGAVYVGEPQPGNRYRLFLVADGRGVTVRLKGSVHPDPATGQLTTVFDDNPQLPFTALDISLDGGPRAVIAAPPGCGAAAGAVTYDPWSGTAPVTAPAAVEVTGCDGPAFAPGFGAATSTAQAGGSGAFTTSFSRPDGQQFLSGVRVALPPGLLATLKGVPRCGEADAAAGRCPAASRIGTASTKSGPGPEPLPLSGPVYLTGPYRGAPFGMVTVIHAVAGPYDLGNVVVRQALHIDPTDAHVTVESDPLPQIVEGIPLRLRALALAVDRPGFMLHPTSCAPGGVGADLVSALGATAAGAAELTFTGCDALAFTPKLRVRLTGKRRAMRVGKHPGVVARLTQRPGQANIRQAAVTLPKSLALDPDNAQALCEYAEAIKVDPNCPRTSIVGSAKAVTPILDEALKGPVYFAKNVRTSSSGRAIRTLPMLVIPLRGGGVKLNLRGTTAVSPKSRLVTTFATVPDAPVSRFDLKIKGGKRGILVASHSVCKRSRVARLALEGHNGKPLRKGLKLPAACRKQARKK